MCMWHLETEHLLLFVPNRSIPIDVSVLPQGLPNPVQSRALALLLGTSFMQTPASQLSDYQAKQLLVSFCNSRKKLMEMSAFKIQYLPSERTIYAFWWSAQPSFCHSVVYSETGKGKPEDSNTASQVFLPTWLFCPRYLPNNQRVVFRKRNWEQAWRNCYIMTTAIC